MHINDQLSIPCIEFCCSIKRVFSSNIHNKYETAIKLVLSLRFLNFQDFIENMELIYLYFLNLFSQDFLSRYMWFEDLLICWEFAMLIRVSSVSINAQFKTVRIIWSHNQNLRKRLAVRLSIFLFSTGPLFNEKWAVGTPRWIFAYSWRRVEKVNVVRAFYAQQRKI